MPPDTEPSTLRLRRRTPFVAGGAAFDDDVHLVVVVGQAVGRRYPIGERLILGRGPNSPIDIVDDGVSREHAALSRQRDGSFTLHDLGSRNGTYLNGQRIESATLAIGDKIAVGSRTVLLLAQKDRYEDQKIQAQKLQALGQLAGGIAHDFNNLLGVVLANITHMQRLERFDEAVTRATLTEVETAARRAVDLTNQLLAFARSGKRQHESTRVCELIVDVKRLLRSTLNSSIEIRSFAPSDLTVIGDSSQLLQVLMNLCINAGDAMPEGGRLRLRAEARTVTEDSRDGGVVAPGEYAVITVHDTGVGMDSATCARIFEPFFTTKPRGKGTGLGLATAHAIVRDHGGHILVDTEPGVGTTFEVVVPAAADSTRADRRLTQDRACVPAGCVLVADDEALVIGATKRVLEHAGVRVKTAKDGLEAVKIYRACRNEIDLVILDLDMPNLDGEGAHAQLREISPDLPILISSGYIDRERESALRGQGVDGILYKPYDTATLVEAIARALRSSDN